MSKLSPEHQIDYIRMLDSGNVAICRGFNPNDSIEGMKHSIREFNTDYTSRIMRAYTRAPMECNLAIELYYFEIQAKGLIEALDALLVTETPSVTPPQTYTEAEQEWHKILRRHDWYWNFSDSGVVWNNGQEAERLLEKEAETCPMKKRYFEAALKYRHDVIRKGHERAVMPDWWITPSK